MTVELVTGHAGSAHVSSADVGWMNVGLVGDGKYVLDTGTQFAANVQSANTVTIGIGDAIFEGRHVRVSATESVSIDNGAQGVNRNDIICIKYEYNSGTGVETASLAVVKGTASAGTATDPTIPSGSILTSSSAAYMPLWRIPISGITVGTPEKLYGDVLISIDDLLTRNIPASQITGSTTTTISSGVTLQTLGKVCVLFVSRSCDLSTPYATVSIGTIPSGYRPISNARGIAVVQDTTGKAVEVVVSTNGAATVNATGGSTLGSHYVHGSVTWICD